MKGSAARKIKERMQPQGEDKWTWDPVTTRGTRCLQLIRLTHPACRKSAVQPSTCTARMPVTVADSAQDHQPESNSHHATDVSVQFAPTRRKWKKKVLLFHYPLLQLKSKSTDSTAASWHKKRDLKSSHVNSKRSIFHLGKTPSLSARLNSRHLGQKLKWSFTFVHVCIMKCTRLTRLSFCRPFSSKLPDYRPRPWNWRQQRLGVSLSVRFCLMLKAQRLVRIERLFLGRWSPTLVVFLRCPCWSSKQMHQCIRKRISTSVSLIRAYAYQQYLEIEHSNVHLTQEEGTSCQWHACHATTQPRKFCISLTGLPMA